MACQITTPLAGLFFKTKLKRLPYKTTHPFVEWEIYLASHRFKKQPVLLLNGEVIWPVTPLYVKNSITVECNLASRS